MAEHLPPALSRRFMIFVPDAVPHFLLVCDEPLGWSVRDYSSGQSRTLPARALGRPVEQILSAPQGTGCLAFQAPRVSTANQSFWKQLTDELDARFLAASKGRASAERERYPLLAEAKFHQVAGNLTAFERLAISRSPRSPEWTTWNGLQLLEAARPRGWWNDLAREAAVVNPGNQFSYFVRQPAVEFWKRVEPSTGYEQRRRLEMSQTPRSAREILRALDNRPLEAATRVDVMFETESWLVFGESALRAGWSERTVEEPRRNRLIQLADCLVTLARGRPCALWLLARDRTVDREYVQLVQRYRSAPETLAAELPYHPAEIVYKVAQRLTVVRWSDVLGALLRREGNEDPLTAQVRKELVRRIGRAAAAAAGTGR